MNIISKCASIYKTIEAPVLTQEMRIRQRGAKPFWVMLVYVLVLCAAALLTFAAVGHGDTSDPRYMSRIGRSLFQVLSIAQLVLIVMIVPAYSSSSISAERERGTFELLAITLLSSGTIIKQKLVAAISQVIMLIAASLPIVAMVFLFGGVSPTEIVVVYGMLIFTAILLSSIGMLCSCCVRNSRTSTFLAYLIPLIAYMGVPFCWSWLQYVGRNGMDHAVATSPLGFTFMFAITGAIPAFGLYGILALLLGMKSSWWQTRAVRIAVFGGSYAILLLAMSSQSMSLFDVFMRNNGLDLVQLLNPFSVMYGYLSDNGYSSASVSYIKWLPFISIAICAGLAYIFERISSLRLNGLRRA